MSLSPSLPDFAMAQKKKNSDYKTKRRTPPPSEATLAKRRSTLEKARELQASKPVNPLSFFQKQSSKVSPSKMMSSSSGRNIAVFDSYGVRVPYNSAKWHYHMQKISQGVAPNYRNVAPAAKKKLVQARKPK